MHPAPDVLARALGLGCGGPVAAAKPDRAGQLAGDEVELLLGSRRALVVGPVTGLLKLLAQLIHARPVGRLGPRVQRRACAGRIIGPQLGSRAGQRGAATRRGAGRGGQQLEHVNLGARMLEQHGEIAQSLGMPKPCLAPAIPKRPMVALAP